MKIKTARFVISYYFRVDQNNIPNLKSCTSQIAKPLNILDFREEHFRQTSAPLTGGRCQPWLVLPSCGYVGICKNGQALLVGWAFHTHTTNNEYE